MTEPTDSAHPATSSPAGSTPATSPSTPSPVSAVRPSGPDRAARASAALTRYRVMAWVTGTMLLVLTLELVLKYVLQLNGVDESGHAKPVIGTWVAFGHGWVYVAYLATVLGLWSSMRWSLGRLATMVLAGVVPVMSFVLERRVHADALARIELLRRAPAPSEPSEPSEPSALGDPS